MPPTARPSDRPTVRPPDRSTGFTLVEMLVVVLIIAILIGLTVKILGGAGRQAAKAVTVNRLERLKHAVEEFYSEYGQYPPVPVYAGAQPVAYEFPWTNGNFTMASGQFAGTNGAGWGEAPLFTFGLMGFLTARFNGEVRGAYIIRPDVFDNPQWRAFNQTDGDIERFLAAMRRWAPFLDGPPDSILNGRLSARAVRSIPYTNAVITVVDGWYRDLCYESKPPYQTYKLWSMGLNGASETNVTSDDIYGNVGQ